MAVYRSPSHVPGHSHPRSTVFSCELCSYGASVSLKTEFTAHIYIYIYSACTNSGRTSQETRHISATERNRLMLCGESIAVCCENRTEHTDTLWAVLPHRKHITSPLQSPTG
jgi:hypothetical protein